MTKSTDSKEIESIEQAELHETVCRSLLESAPDGMIVVDDQGRIVLANRQIEKLFGYSRDELLGQPIELLVPESQRAAHGRHRERYRTAPVSRAMGAGARLTGQRKDGSEFPLEIALTPLESARGVLVAATIHDLSDRSRLEEQLRQAQKMEAIGLLAGGVAHDFNNLLCVILSYCDLLLTDLGPSDRSRDDVFEIKRAGQRAADLTGQLLAFSRRQVFAPRVVNLNDVIASMERMLRRVLGEHIELSTKESSNLRKAKLDPSQIEQIILNLSINARDAMPGGGKLTIETANVELDEAYAKEHFGVVPGPHVMVAISDSGHGMDKTIMSHLFEPFFTTKLNGKGTGLGLSTVFGIVQQSGGSIWVYSEPGNGTVFKVYFPITLEEPNIDVAPVVVGARGRAGETILLVEDDPQVRTVVRSILNRHAYQVFDAQNASEALLLSERFSGPIHLLLTDVVMPDMNGHQLAERLVSARPATKVLYMSGYTENTVIHHGVLQAGIHFIQKPITPETLLQKIRDVLDGVRH